MEKRSDALKTISLALLVIGLLCILFGGGSGVWLLQNSIEIAESLPPPPEGPPDAGAYGMLFGYVLLLFGVGIGLTILLAAGILALVRGYRRRQEAHRTP